MPDQHEFLETMRIRDVGELLFLARNAFIDDKTECDLCNRYPTSEGDSMRLCSRCELGEFLEEGDLGRLHEELVRLGKAEM